MVVKAAVSEHRPQLSLMEQLSHAVRVRSVKSAATALLGGALNQMAPRWSLERAPWYAGRLAGAFNLKTVLIDRARFSVPSGPDETFLSGLLWLERYETLERHAVLSWLPREVPVVELGASIGV